uniref:Tudor domain-containing protein n=1 Tax=Setaria digitata TaxID=48799 RepID=A0A915PDQ6_9BILA
MDGTPLRRHFKSVFPNSSVYPGLCAALKVKRTGLYAARVNGSWKRVRVDRIDYQTNQCAIELIDDGQLLTVSRNELFILDPKLMTNQYKRTFSVRFVLPRKPERNSLSAAGFVDGQKLHNGQLVNIFVFSDREPFLALFTEAFTRIQVQKLVDDLDPGSARLWATTLAGGSDRCRGVAFGSYTMAILPCDVWCDVTVAAFESLEDVQVRGPEQSIRLMYLEQFLESVYGNVKLRDRLTFETGVHVSEGLACVAWDASNQRWVRARVTFTSGDRSVVDVISVDYPSITLRSLKFRSGEIYMLRTDLLFPPLCCSVRVIDANDKLEAFTKSAVAKEVLQVGIHVRVYSPASSTLSVIELANGLKLEEYIEHAMEIDSIRCSELEHNYPDDLENINTRLGRLYFTSGRGSHADMTSFSSSMGFPRTVLVPQEPFSHSLSLGSQRRTLPLRCGINSLQSSKQHSTGACNLAASRLRSVPPSPILPLPPSLSPSLAPSHFKTPELFSHSNVDLPPTPNFENDYLNKSLTSYESDSENETFSKSVRQKQSKESPDVAVRPSPPLYNSDSYSENSDFLRREACNSVQVEVLSINCATEIFLSTADTKMQYESLKSKLACLDAADLLPVSGSWCSQNEHYLFWFDEGCWSRVKILIREDDDWKVLCVDTGEEKYVKYNSRFYRLPRRLSIEEWPPTCLGPLRLSGPVDARWLGIGARIFLRSICEEARQLTATFGRGESDRSIMLYDEEGRCLNEHFVKFIEKHTLIK